MQLGTFTVDSQSAVLNVLEVAVFGQEALGVCTGPLPGHYS